MTGRIPKHEVSADVELDDFLVLKLAGWDFAKEIRRFIKGSADLYRLAVAAHIVQGVVREPWAASKHEIKAEEKT